MQIRDARAPDDDAIAALATGDVDATQLRQARTVKVAVEDANGTESGESAEAETEAEAEADVNVDATADGERGDVVGFVAYDARPDAVHVTRVGGDEDAVADLLDAPVSFGASENLPVEAVVPGGGAAAAALETRGFADVGAGPRFEGRSTRRYRYEP